MSDQRRKGGALLFLLLARTILPAIRAFGSSKVSSNRAWLIIPQSEWILLMLAAARVCVCVDVKREPGG